MGVPLDRRALAGTIWGGKHAAFSKGAEAPRLRRAARSTTTPSAPLARPRSIGTLFATALQNGVMLRDRVYFADGAGLAGAQARHLRRDDVRHRDRSRLGARRRSWSRCTRTGSSPRATRRSRSASTSPRWRRTVGRPPPGTRKSYIDTSRDDHSLRPDVGRRSSVFHPKSIEKIRGAIPPGANLDTDMFTDMFTDQMGCEDPASVCQWQENVIFANARGVHLTDGATIRSLSDQGSIGDFWRTLYSAQARGHPGRVRGVPRLPVRHRAHRLHPAGDPRRRSRSPSSAT